MGQSWFAWNGIDCRAMGITLAGPVAIVRPEERVEHVTIPGRAGELTLLEGDDIYQSYIQTAELQVRGGFRVREIYNWLKGAGEVIFHGEPDRKQKARIIGAVTLDKHSRNLDIWTGNVQFYCEPFKEKLITETVTVTSSGASVRNNGDVTSKPKLTVTASGTTVKVKSGGKELTITGATSSTVYTVDCDSHTVTHLSSGTLVNDTKLTSGEWPQLLPGANSVTGSGWSSIVIDRRERFL